MLEGVHEGVLEGVLEEVAEEVEEERRGRKKEKIRKGRKETFVGSNSSDVTLTREVVWTGRPHISSWWLKGCLVGCL